MVRITVGSVSIGVLFGIVNMILVPLLSETFHDTTIPGALVSIGMVLAAAAGPAVGRWSDRTGRRVLPVGVLVGASCIGMLLLMCRATVPVSAGAVLVTLCAYGMSTPYSALVSARSAPARRTRDFGLVMGVANGSGFLVSLVIGVLATRGMDLALAVLAGLTLLPFLPLATVRGGSGGQSEGVTGVAPRSPVLSLFLAMQFCFWFSLGGLFPHFTSFLSSETAVSLSDASLWFGASILVSSLVSVAAGRLGSLFSPRRLLLLCLVAIAVISSLAWALYGTVVRGAGATAFGIASFLVMSAALGLTYALSSAVLSLLVSPRDQGRVFGLNGIATILSQAISVVVFGAVIARWGYRSMLLLCASGFAAAGLAAAAMVRAADSASHRARLTASGR